MANVLIEENTLTDIANSIRAKTGTTEKMLPSDMPALIEGITGGGSGDSSDILKYVTFMSEDGTTELFKMPVISGDDCKEPIAHGDIETPTKESTNTQHFTYSGWSAESGGSADTSVLENITEDKVVYASFVASVRYYTVNFYDDDNVTLLHTAQVTYGADATNVFLAEKDGYRFVEWSPSVANITEDTNTYASWEESLRLNDASWETIAEKSADGTASQLWKVGDEKILTLNDGSQVPVVIVGFNHDDLSDGSGKAGITFAFNAIPFTGRLASGYWEVCTSMTYDYLAAKLSTETIATEYMPENLINLVKPVNKKWYDLKGATLNESTNNTFWLFSISEIGYDKAGTVYNEHKEGDKYDYFPTIDSTTTAYSHLIIPHIDESVTSQYEKGWMLRTMQSVRLNYHTCYVSYDGRLNGIVSTTTNMFGYRLGFCI